ncbi:MAG: D-alanine--D-alanine ligase [Lachnospiraceae bacterium]|nr:D-alanine--D-alanine ligase [Lachnospiraceae bacterium]
MSKKTVAVFFGGQSTEHAISCISGTTFAKAIDRDKYDVILVGITKDGRWLLADDIDSIVNKTWYNSKKTAIMSPEADDPCLIVIEGNHAERVHIDVAFPTLHGMFGEDGTIQGLFNLARVKYVGCGCLASAMAMDKVYTKLVVDTLGIRQAKYVVIKDSDIPDMDGCIKKVKDKIESFPVFVKPSRSGSSVGMTKAENEEQLAEALRYALKFDRKILVEEAIVGREIECAVIGDYDDVKASGVGEILAADTFYTYDAKYNNAESKTVVRPTFPAGKEDEVRRDAVAIFKALDGYGLSRVDFFMEKDTNEVVFNEINTLPGHTSISMYPMLWTDKGLDIKQEVQQLIDLALKRWIPGDDFE